MKKKKKIQEQDIDTDYTSDWLKFFNLYGKFLACPPENLQNKTFFEKV